MSATTFILSSRVFDANGVIAPGAKVYFYLTGGLTPESVFTTSGLGTPHANPVVADGGGKLPNIYLDTTKTYRVVGKSSDDATTYFDIDPYNPQSAATFVNVTIDTAAPNTIKINGNTLSASVGTATVTVPNTTDTLVGRATTDTLTNKTLTSPTINAPAINNPTFTGTPVEDIYTITDGAAFEIDPANGSIQLVTLGANRTPKGTNISNGQSVFLGIDDGSTFTLTWTDTTFGASGVKWIGGAAPALAATGYTWVTLWKIGGQVYGVLTGSTS